MQKTLITFLLFFVGVAGYAQWSAVGDTNIVTFDSSILCSKIDATGNLYVAGVFTNSNGKKYVAKWDGISWTELGTGVNSLNANSRIYSICIDAIGNLYAAGDFTNSSGKRYVAKWNGTSWSELGTGINTLNANGVIHSVCVDATGNVYAAGNFTNSGGKAYVAKWNGIKWIELGTGINTLNASVIVSICTNKLGILYAVGNITNSSAKYYVARWNGAVWGELGTGINSLNPNNFLRVVTTDSAGNVYAAGDFTNSNSKRYVAKWNGTNWSELGMGSNSLNAEGFIFTVYAVNPNKIYTNVYKSSYPSSYYVAEFNGTNWGRLGTGADTLVTNYQGSIHTICGDNAGNVYAAGNIKRNNGNYYVAKYTYAVLPLKITSFDVRLNAPPNSTLVNWQTENEVNVSHFNIQRSINGRDFINIGNVKAESFSSYSFLDNKLPIIDQLTFYYRIESVDNDGKKQYSTIKQINLNHSTSINIFPNPAKSLVKIECANAKKIIVTDYLGRQVIKLENNLSNLNIDCKQLPKGIYLVQAQLITGEIRIEKLVVQ